MRLTLFSSTLRAGGAERAVVTLAEGFKSLGHDVSIVIWNSFEHDFYKIPAGVERSGLDLTPDQTYIRWYDLPGNIRRAWAIRRAISDTNPDAVISFQDGTNELFILSSIGARYLKLLSCQNDLTKRSHINSRWNFMRKNLYRLGDRVVFLDIEQAKHGEKQYKGWKCDGIPNPVSTIDLTPDDASTVVINELEKFPLRIVAMGRMVPQKGFDMLLKAFAGVLNIVPGTGLVILGEGPLRSELQEQCKTLGVENNVLMPGVLAKPHSVIGACDIFAFSSRYEGQGLALVEAMVCGTPPVSFDCPSGPNHIIRHEVDGLLVAAENVDALENGLVMLLLDSEKRLAMGEKAKEASARYNVEETCRQWEGLIGSLQPA